MIFVEIVNTKLKYTKITISLSIFEIIYR